MIQFLLWLVWGLYFVIVEGIALFRHRRKDTFSWQVWTGERKWPWLRGVVGAILIWLLFHFKIF